MAEIIPLTIQVATLLVLRMLSRTESLSSGIILVEIREREKSKLMQVCVDCTRSPLNELQHQKTIELTTYDTSTSTGINNDDDSQDSENMKLPVLLSSNENNHPLNRRMKSAQQILCILHHFFELQTFNIFIRIFYFYFFIFYEIINL